MLIKREPTGKLKTDLVEVRKQMKKLNVGTQFANRDDADFYHSMIRREKEIIKELRVRGEE